MNLIDHLLIIGGALSPLIAILTGLMLFLQVLSAVGVLSLLIMRGSVPRIH